MSKATRRWRRPTSLADDAEDIEVEGVEVEDDKGEGDR